MKFLAKQSFFLFFSCRKKKLIASDVFQPLRAVLNKYFRFGAGAQASWLPILQSIDSKFEQWVTKFESSL